jgi:hypothetical protein
MYSNSVTTCRTPPTWLATLAAASASTGRTKPHQIHHAPIRHNLDAGGIEIRDAIDLEQRGFDLGRQQSRRCCGWTAGWAVQPTSSL